MSEVIWYYDEAEGGGVQKVAGLGSYVKAGDFHDMEADFDAQRLRADKAESERDAAKAESKALAELDDVTIANLGSRMKAAEQRIAELSANNQQLRKLLEQTLAALNPTKNLSKSIRAALNQKSEGESHE